jgi:histidine ammonia-lyase
MNLTARQKIEISGDRLTLEQVAAVARAKNRVELTPNVEVRQSLLEEKLERGEIIYGVNTGFGGNVRFLIPAADVIRHQENIFRFMTCGSGTPLPTDTVRASILLRANALAKGFSGVRLRVIESLLDLLNHDITPIVPRYGSVGASGDLIPSAPGKKNNGSRGIQAGSLKTDQTGSQRRTRPY